MIDQKTEKRLLEKYRGLKIKDLDIMNPEYSCVICGQVECKNMGKVNMACPDATPATEEQFALKYDFERE
jgi:hypothetical protein